MNPDDILHQYWIYELPNKTRVVAEKGEDGKWELWEYWIMSYGGRAGNIEYSDFAGISKHSHLEVTQTGKILDQLHGEICSLDDIQDTGYTLDIKTGAQIMRKKALDDFIQSTSNIDFSVIKDLEIEVEEERDDISKDDSKKSWWRKLFSGGF